MHHFINSVIFAIVIFQLLKMKGLFEISDQRESIYNDYIQLHIIFVEFDFWNVEEQLLHYKIHNKLKLQIDALCINHGSKGNAEPFFIF